jgi:hypothetical protein
MGGDDLGSDDEAYLAARVVDDDGSGRERGRERGYADSESSRISSWTANVADGRAASIVEGVVDGGPRRKRSKKSDDISSSSNSKNGREINDDAALFRQAIHVASQSPRQQAAFLQLAIGRHYSNASSVDSVGSGEGSTRNISLIRPSHFVSFESESRQQQGQQLSILDKLRYTVPAKKLKNWGSSQNKEASPSPSPCVIVVCLSARRAVSVLHELAPLGVRVAKLFPKNGSVQDQVDLLSRSGGKCCSVAVGTPHRLLVLARELARKAVASAGSGGGNKVSRFTDRTLLVVLDGHVSSNKSTVCTMADTAPHCMEFLAEHVLPQLHTRKDLKLAFF